MILLKSKSSVYFFYNTRTEVDALMGLGPENSTKRKNISHNSKGVPGSCMGTHSFATLFGRNWFQKPNGQRRASVDPYYSGGNWKAGAMALTVIRI